MLKKLINNQSAAPLFLVSLSASIGAAVYYFFGLGQAGLAAAIALSAGAYYIIHRLLPGIKACPPAAAPASRLGDRLSFYASLALFAGLFRLLAGARTDASLSSPWQAVPPLFFALLAAFFLVLIYQAGRGRRFFALSLSLFCLVVFSAAVTVFPLGFGFDPFIHQASLEVIKEQGAIEPKTPYYLGQYALVMIAGFVLPFLPLAAIHYYLVPFLAAALVPAVLLGSLGRWLADEVAARYAALSLLILPFGFLTVTTPQNLSWLFLLLAVFASLGPVGARGLALAGVLAAAALATQAVAGLPAAGFALMLALHHSRLAKKRLYIGLSAMGMALSVPLSFLALNGWRLSRGAFASSGLARFLPSNPNTETIGLNAAYFYISNYPLFFLALAAAGIWLAYQHRQKSGPLYIYLLSALAMAASYLILLAVDFSYLISYEQSDFADRSLVTAAIFLLPFVIISLHRFFVRLRLESAWARLPFWALASVLAGVAVYASYPAYDHYRNSHAHTVSRHDLEAVRWIEADSQGQDYIVLSNQQVAAAALREFGFKRYYRPPGTEPVFYYSIPTGGPLYRHYLDMVYRRPTRAVMAEAMGLAGVKRSYFVLNRYWWAYDKVLAEARLEADSCRLIGGNEAAVCRYASD